MNVESSARAMGERLVFMAYDSGQCTNVCACELTHGMHYEHKWPRTCNLPLATFECVLLSYTVIHSYIHICYLRHVDVYSNRLHFFLDFSITFIFHNRTTKLIQITKIINLEFYKFAVKHLCSFIGKDYVSSDISIIFYSRHLLK